jgi:expansin (peptidoglycan-binding protein)
MFWLILAFAAGVYVGYKYPEQVTKAVDSSKNMFNEIKDKLTKKDTPPSQ